MNGAATNETSEMVVEIECKGKGDDATDNNIKTNSENHVIEVELIELTDINHGADLDDQGSRNSFDCDHSAACGPYSNCPCSVHSKPTVSDDSEDETLTDHQLRNTQNMCEEDEHSVLVDESQSLKDGVTLEPQSRCKRGNKNNDTPSIQNSVTSVDGSQSSLATSHFKFDQYNRVNIYAEETGPKLYPTKDSLITRPIITKNLSEAFKFLPIFGMPETTEGLSQFQDAKVREYVGCDLSDEEFKKLASFCSPDHLRTGNELKMSTNTPRQDPLPDHVAKSLEISELGQNLCLVKKLKLRIDKDKRKMYTKKLIYRGLKMLPLPQNAEYKLSSSPLEPGKDLLFRVRVYRPFFYMPSKRRRHSRHSIFSNDIVLLGSQKLSVLRDRLVCANDVGMRVDSSHNPDEQQMGPSAKDVFPSGFLFINNAFYVDSRAGCKDHSAPIRRWASERGLGDFPRHDMTQVSLDQLLVRLGNPEIYVHQGNCEHLFVFSEVRLLSATDPLRPSVYPFHTAVAQHQTIYCSCCAELGAKWIVTECSRVPFDPAYFCETCFKLFLYKDGKKVCDFKAYSYRGNEINILKPVG